MSAFLHLNEKKRKLKFIKVTVVLITWDDNKNGYTQGLHVSQRAHSHRLKVKNYLGTWPTNTQFIACRKMKKYILRRHWFIYTD